MTIMIDEELVKDLFRRQQRAQAAIRAAGADGLLLTTDVNIYYMTGVVFSGYYYLPAEGEAALFVKKPDGLSGEHIFPIRKPEQIPDFFWQNEWVMPEKLLVEVDVVSYSECLRLQKALGFEEMANASVMMRQLRAVKTPWEIGQLRKSAALHAATYARIRELYRPGMTDLQLQAEIEHEMRQHGSIGLFRTYGPNMNIFMGSLLAGDNAENPSPFDFALGGSGQTPLCPLGANGTTVLKNGTTIMVDMAGNYTDYLTDMTRVFSVGKLPGIAHRAHQVALDIQAAVEDFAKPGVACADIYNLAYALVEKAELTGHFMGTRQQAKFVGHGIGIEINEPPVLTARSKELLAPGIVFALEPKFVIPHVGAVGIENSFAVTDTGIEKLTVFEEGIIPLD